MEITKDTEKALYKALFVGIPSLTEVFMNIAVFTEFKFLIELLKQRKQGVKYTNKELSVSVKDMAKLRIEMP
jgi:hypothetical protein